MKAFLLCACWLVVAQASVLSPARSFLAVAPQHPARCDVVLQQKKKKKPPKAAKKAASTAVVDAEEDLATQQARTTLLGEIAKEQRSMDTITTSLATLEASPVPGKLKRAVVGDWKLVFASDQSAVAPFVTGASDGPFAVLEDIYHRVETLNVQSIEITRKIGPFGNMCNSLHGKWSVADGDGDVMSWKTQYMLDERGREVKPPGGGASHRARASHISSELLVLRPEAAAQSYAVFTKLGKGKLKKELDDYSIDTEMFIGPAA